MKDNSPPAVVDYAAFDLPVEQAAVNPDMSLWQSWTEQPQNLWVRRAFFQIHLWVGIGIGLYILAISISGSALVFGREITAKYSRPPLTVGGPGPRLAPEELKQDIQRLYPDYKVGELSPGRRVDRPLQVELDRGKGRIVRLFDPYTGADLGDPLTKTIHAYLWVVDFHDNLLSGMTGRLVNGIGSICVTLLGLTGAVLWWRGKKNWRRGLKFQWKSALPRFNFDLHSAVGFWCYLYILLWGISGIYFSFPRPFNAASDYLFPTKPHSRTASFGDTFIFWLSRLHFGRFGWQIQTLWVILGLVPAALFITGALMWWNRSLRKNRWSSSTEG